MWDLIYSFCLKHFSFQEELSEIRLNMYISLHAKYMSFLSDFNEILIFSIVLKKNAQISNFMKIRPVGAELLHAEKTVIRNMTKLIVAFRNFAKAPNIITSRTEVQWDKTKG
jgi:hypothetical protein